MSTKRTQIINVAAGIIHSKGYENTKVSDVLESAQIGKGQFYHYFSSKHELGLAVLSQVYDYWNRCLLENILSSPKDPRSKIDEMFEWVINQQRINQAKHGCVFGNLAVEMSEHDEVFRQQLQNIFDSWEEKLKIVIKEMLSSSHVDAVKIENLAQGIVAMLEGGILLMKNKQEIKVLINIVEIAKKTIDNFVQENAK